MGIISHFPSFVNSFFEKSQKKLFSDRCKTVKKAQIHVCPEPKIHFFRESLIFFEKRLDKRLNLWYNITVPKRRFLCKGRRWCGSMAEQLICNQQVVGSTPTTSSKRGKIPEWPKGADCKSVGTAFGGSNPPLPTKKKTSLCGVFFLCWESWILRGLHRAAHYATNHLSVLDASLCVQARSLSLLYESTSSHHKETIILIRKISVLWLFYCKIRVFCPFSLIF